ncbi:16S rRNA (guanine527-N7)-methyltransferase [Rhodoblastus acidophilus]|uniref:Ribosomal RNA small subunit methyltransferase G n=1 Tax=Rhodoblastus acidophilus TaxID=1074 RepID=A0A212S4Q1_RHOAC|nr:16S rRNA (guanine(527)-N(7))-methyltransferase RsmG [Rhodoblastus acidophilus]PPQ37736.1 16S rRNA (guanine(527)-N(7))-methyltransferase RsmG [Rhodoblastus acidophilus]RAI23948.1 16S rRNA (guanine(527)-N(7))-methyltransferase RsmG [Rhodoblastus acidophilus]SNB80154.1 16S rRNA (guanine527-N7)-methyltransferase [Rhodoblastus acidophilus]
MTVSHARALSQLGFELGAEQLAKLRIYEDLLKKWQGTLNLVGRSTLNEIWPRHFIDSLQLIPLAGTWANWIDIGSGAGFPGLVIGLVSGENGIVHLVESDKRKAAFLAEVSRETNSAIQIHVGRIECVLPELVSSTHFEIISARALAPMKTLLDYARPILIRGGRGLFFKGKELASELTNLPGDDSFSYETVNSVTDPTAKIVIVHSVNS